MAAERRGDVMETVINRKKTGAKYSVGAIAELVLELFAAYGVFYMTTAQFMDPGVAGTILGLGSVAAIIASIVVGYYSDISTAKEGRRRFFIIRFLVLMTILFIVFFLPLNLTGVPQVVFYAVVGILVYFAFTAFLVPYDALVGEIVLDYNERTFVRTLCTVFIFIGVVLADTLSTFLRTFFSEAGQDTKMSWFLMAVIMGLVAFFAAFYAWRVAKGVETVPEPADVRKKVSIIKEYAEILKVKAVRILSLYFLVYFISSALVTAMIFYFGVYVLNLDENTASLFFVIIVIVTIASQPLIDALSKRFGKRAVVYVGAAIVIVYVIYLLIAGASSFADGIVLSIVFGFGNATVITCAYAMSYDLYEVVEFKTGESKPTGIMGVMSCARMIGVALGTALLGQLLVAGKFDGAVLIQSEHTVQWMVYSITIVPLVVSVVCLVLLSMFKINNKNHDAISKALELKRDGKEYSTEGFEELLK
jgi:GPH family glycoside/pentoside/hexuronide:cation symporter